MAQRQRDSNGTNRTRLLPYGGDPAWSPDGGTIAFADSGGVYVMSSGGTSATRLTADGSQPAWSPDGAKIAFTGWTTECYEEAGPGFVDVSLVPTST